ncbi:MarR family transcriptional regulator [Ferrigenium kumadai]|uniref:MarR family transcriptional regulator n=1 Tax=Ferrigenium kumadai TaxID=1682490 RepID=A0AAN1VZW2_9PROT|nr:transcriptional regulator [Ferrigenium kumadai]BBI99858.1 MarR family transcriptional regulator [Ferrigenium kumadai]
MDILDPLLHQPLRTQLAAFLAGAGEVTFTELKRQLDVSDGNLDSHLKKLIAADYVKVRKDDSGGRTQSYYALTPAGREALHVYVVALQKLLPFDDKKTNISKPVLRTT